jgi:hypothetical protein
MLREEGNQGKLFEIEVNSLVSKKDTIVRLADELNGSIPFTGQLFKKLLIS